MKKLILASLLSIIAAISIGQPLSAIEKRIILSIDKDMGLTMNLLKESVNINSGTYNIAGVKKVGELYARELEALGFTTEWISLPDSLKRAGHLVASRKGTKGKKLFLIGHLDTVFEPDMPPNPFGMLNDSIATGQGVVDMKGGDVLIIAAMKALYKENLLDDATITIYFTGDEENAGRPREISRGDFIERAKKHDIALAFESAEGMKKVATARRGASEWRLETRARQGHSSGIFREGGYGSIYEITRIVNEFRVRFDHEKYLTVNTGLVMGGSEMNYDTAGQKGEVSGKTNIISPQAVAIGDLRFLTDAQKEKTRNTMRGILSKHLPGADAKIYFKDGIPSMPPTAGNNKLVNLLSNASIAIGYGEVKAGDPGSRGAGDISYIAKYLDCLDGLGASGKGAHAPGETINVNEYPKLIKRTAIFIYRLTR